MVGAFLLQNMKKGVAALVPSLLLHFNGTNGSTTITDSSPNGHTTTAVGNAQLTTTSPKFGSACLTLDGSGDWLTVPAHSSFDMGTGDFTIELFFKQTATAGTRNVIAQNVASSTANNLSIRLTGSTTLTVNYAGTTVLSGTMTTPSDGNWHHLAIVRLGNTGTAYFDGASLGTWSMTGNSVWNNSTGLIIGAGSVGNEYHGEFDELRIVKGTAAYTAPFTPPTAEFT